MERRRPDPEGVRAAAARLAEEVPIAQVVRASPAPGRSCWRSPTGPTSSSSPSAQLLGATDPGARLVTLPGMGHDLTEPLWPRVVEEVAAHARSSSGQAQRPGGRSGG